ncbi:MAG TPA: CADD family putative folate metabolism protein [Acidobacteriaceae bacterium]|jgi:pyrroloquinoline-quinone synthase|nr:CADD family putative folate metabolism protein [Acidobacteriaceae bacterium]
MNDSSTVFFSALEGRIERYDLLKHPYYQAWSKGELTRDDLREYASEYWHHVSSFPAYLSALHSQLPDGKLRRSILENLADEEGLQDGVPHSDLWMDFARGMGAENSAVRNRVIGSETRALLDHYRSTMSKSPVEALAALYAYESRVPAIAKTKAEGLERHYGTDAATRRYFTIHTTADVQHARVWKELLSAELASHPENAEAALQAAEDAAHALWRTLDGIEAGRQARMAAAV